MVDGTRMARRVVPIMRRNAVTSTADPGVSRIQQAPHPQRWRMLGLLGVAQLMLIVDVTVVAIALPHMQADLGLSRAAVTWTVSVYTLVFGGLLLLGGRIADLLGAKRVVLAGLLVFTAASLVTGLADSAGAFCRASARP
jgi:MFS family permease